MASIYISISIYEAVLILTVVFFFYKYRDIDKRQLAGYFTVPVVLYIVAMIVPTLLFAVHSRYAGQGYARTFFALAYLPALAVGADTGLLKKYGHIIFAGGVVWAATAYIKYFVLKAPAPHGLWGSAFELGNLVSISAMVAFGMIASSHTDTPLRKALYVLAFFFMTGTIVLTFERTAWLDMGFGIVFFLYLSLGRMKISRKSMVLAGMVLALALGLSVRFFARHDPRFLLIEKMVAGKKITYGDLNTITSDRLYKLTASLRIIGSDIEHRRYLNVVLGHGFRAGAAIKGIDYGPEPVNSSFESISFVSEYIDTGVLGIAYMLLIYMYFLVLLSRLKRIGVNDGTSMFTVYGITAGIGAYLFGSLFNIFVTPPFFFYLFLLGAVENFVRKETVKKVL